ncbi:MAG TPA: MFS transporter [Oscillatoriaceae cyanobacterium]
MDRLPWSMWHWMIVVGLGTVWILDGLQVNIVGAIAGALTDPKSGLALTTVQVGWAATYYIIGACIGALIFGRATDVFGRKKLFLVTLGVYLVGTVLTAVCMNPTWYFICRIITGAGIGGEYAAINSAIDELIPARLRGTVDLAINGSFWIGTLFAALISVPLMNPHIFPINVGWRVAFGSGAVFALVILLVRKNVPESPRWLFMHHKLDEAEAIVSNIEREIEKQTGKPLEPVDEYITVRHAESISFADIMRAMLFKYPSRTVLGLALFIGQAFLYNAVFFTFVMVLEKFFKVPGDTAPLFIIPLAVGNFLGPILLGPAFDRVGRKVMISLSYIGSGALLIGTGLLFQAGVLNATTLTICWCAVFFFASAGASAAYLTVSEIFPMETRAMAIAVYYAIGTLVGGGVGPVLFGALISSGQVSQIVSGYWLGAALMIAAGIVEIFLGVEAAGKSLEDIAPPLSEQHEDSTAPAAAA